MTYSAPSNKALQTVVAAWLTKEEAGGMTVNERLAVAGLMDDFDAAVARRDEPAIRAILIQVFLTEPNIDAIVRHVLPVKA
jgi:hypothetical protein